MIQIEQREMWTRARDASRYVLNTLGQPPQSESSQGSSHPPSSDYSSWRLSPPPVMPYAIGPHVPMGPPPYLPMGHPPYMGAGPSHATDAEFVGQYSDGDTTFIMEDLFRGEFTNDFDIIGSS
ncbi:hypothetical protein PVAP13_8KG079200 [Panicum virgatum]|uniref:Uncharacterized protein n=2 Tax=Panicum virgatum TaxID=38727 RepID=A0A8T0PND0_PANVG|nr:hypothetical protein PVAP13_8KG079200 [Panicum virgatum]